MSLLNIFKKNKKFKVEATIDVNAPQDKVFDFLRRPSEHVKIMPGLVALHDAPSGLVQEGTKYGFSYQMYGIGLNGEWLVTKLVPPARYEGCTTGDVTSYWTYEVLSVGDHARIMLTVEYTPPHTIFEKVKMDILNAINQQSAEAFLQNVKTILEQ